MYFSKVVVCILSATLFVASATAQVSMNIESVDNSSQLTGYETQDIEVLTNTDWNGAALLLELTAGSIYQDSAGDDTEPNSAWFSYFPSLEFDTYVSGSTAGAAGDVGGDTFQFDTEELDVTWFNTDSNDIGTIGIGRITLSDNAAGTWTLAVSKSGEDPMEVFTGTISNGVMIPD